MCLLIKDMTAKSLLPLKQKAVFRLFQAERTRNNLFIWSAYVSGPTSDRKLLSFIEEFFVGSPLAMRRPWSVILAWFIWLASSFGYDDYLQTRPSIKAGIKKGSSEPSWAFPAATLYTKVSSNNLVPIFRICFPSERTQSVAPPSMVFNCLNNNSYHFHEKPLPFRLSTSSMWWQSVGPYLFKVFPGTLAYYSKTQIICQRLFSELIALYRFFCIEIKKAWH